MLRAFNGLRLLLPLALIVASNVLRLILTPARNELNPRQIAVSQAIVVPGASLDPLGRCVPLTSDVCSATISTLSVGGTDNAHPDEPRSLQLVMVYENGTSSLAALLTSLQAQLSTYRS